MNTKVAFLVPIHPPHFKYARDLLASLQKNEIDKQADLWFVFTNEEEQAVYGDYANAVVLPPELCLFENGGIINIKKFYGLRQIQDKYEYVIVLDAESLLIRQTDVYSVCEEYFTSKILLGNELLPEGLERTQPIKDACKRFFASHSDFEKLNDPLYLWFNQPCIYKTSTLPDFWDRINYEKNIEKLVWHDFDYYIYMFYLILFQGFCIENLEIASNYGICEASLDLLFFKSNKYERLPIFMVSQGVLHKFDNPKLFIMIHLDRDRDWMFRVMSHKTDACIQRTKEIQNEMHNQMKEKEERISYLAQKIQEKEERISYLAQKIQEIEHWQKKWTMKNIIRRLIARFIPIRKLQDKIRG